MLESKIKELTAAVEALTQAINASQAPSTQPTAEPETKVVEPTPDPTPTLSDADLSGLLVTMSREGHKVSIREKLTDFGAARVSELDAADREAFVDWLIELSERA